MSTPPTKVKTRILIISDTHGKRPQHKWDFSSSTDDELSREDILKVPTGYRHPLPEVDVVLHCGDLTKRTRVSEYEETFAMLRAIRAPLKLAIAGNHDVTLDEDYWVNSWGGPQEDIAPVRKIIEDAKEDGVHYLTEGVYEFNLDNGARLRVYASQYTPMYGGWGFQYIGDHEFHIPSDVDVAMTHGPPRGVLDVAAMSRLGAGCPHLFRAIHKARPKIHCFGHIHEAWGMQLAHWKEGDGTPTRYATVIDEEKSPKTTLKDIRLERSIEDPEEIQRRRKRLIEMSKQRGMLVDLTEGETKLVEGEQTLFLNAAIMDIRYKGTQMPWLVDVDLPRA